MKRRQRLGGCSHKPRPPGMLETTRGQKRQGGPSPEPVEGAGAGGGGLPHLDLGLPASGTA